MQGSKYFISSDGSQFMTRRLAMKHLISEQYSEEEVDAMREALREDGWRDDPLLPKAWRYKTIAGGSKPGMEHIKFLTAAGDVLDGLDRARSLVKDGQEFTEKEAEGLKVFIDILTVRARSVRYNWNENDQTIPEGWKSR